MSEIKIAKTLKQAVGMGPAHVADLIRQKLTLLQFHLEEGVVPKDAIQAFMQNLGMDEIKMSLEAGCDCGCHVLKAYRFWSWPSEKPCAKCGHGEVT